MALKSVDSGDELFAKSPKILKYSIESEDNLEKENLKASNVRNDEIQSVKSVKKVPSNITCHCSGIDRLIHWSSLYLFY